MVDCKFETDQCQKAYKDAISDKINSIIHQSTTKSTKHIAEYIPNYLVSSNNNYKFNCI